MTANPVAGRLSALRQRMEETGTDLVAIGPGAHMQWLLGFHPHADERPCLLLVGRHNEVFLMPALNAEGSRQSTDIPFHNWADEDGPAAALDAALEAVGAKAARTIVLDETMRADFAFLVRDRLGGVRHGFTEATVGALRMRKDDGEYRLLKENALINDRAMQIGFAALRPGVSEQDVADAIRAHYPTQGAKAQFSIIGAGSNGAFPHHATGNRPLREGDAVVMDIGGSKDGYFSDMTRMAVIGHAPDGYAAVHAVVEAAVKAALKAARPGVRANEVDAAARGVITDAGYGPYFVHRTGHGLGSEVHEPPYLTSVSQTVLETGMVFSIEPGIYLPGRFGIRLEEIVILRENGPEILSDLPRDLFVAGD